MMTTGAGWITIIGLTLCNAFSSWIWIRIDFMQRFWIRITIVVLLLLSYFAGPIFGLGSDNNCCSNIWLRTLRIRSWSCFRGISSPIKNYCVFTNFEIWRYFWTLYVVNDGEEQQEAAGGDFCPFWPEGLCARAFLRDLFYLYLFISIFFLYS